MNDRLNALLAPFGGTSIDDPLARVVLNALALKLAAAVPDLAEYVKTCPPAKCMSFTNARLSSKSASLSPGKPVMISVVMAMPGMAFLAVSTRLAKDCGVVLRAMWRSVAALPDCKGRCK